MALKLWLSAGGIRGVDDTSSYYSILRRIHEDKNMMKLFVLKRLSSISVNMNLLGLIG
jgi:hypothetical protein